MSLNSKLKLNEIFCLQPVTEGYQYSQLSPSRSPSGPTYTQLSSGARTPATQYHAVTTVPSNPGYKLFQF